VTSDGFTLVQLFMRPGRKHADMTQRFCERVAANLSEVAVKPADVCSSRFTRPGLEKLGISSRPSGWLETPEPLRLNYR
jgi:hypothetical protein